jgi:calmodulin
LTDAQIASYKEAFASFDTDGSGAIDANELANVLKKLKIRVSRNALRRMVKAIDKDGNGEIDFDEFIVMMKEVSNPAREVREAFKTMDLDKDDKISRDDLKKFITQLEGSASDDMIDAMMSVADKDKDGFVTLKEFQAIVKD